MIEDTLTTKEYLEKLREALEDFGYKPKDIMEYWQVINKNGDIFTLTTDRKNQQVILHRENLQWKFSIKDLRKNILDGSFRVIKNKG